MIDNIYMIAAITSKSRAIGYKGDLVYHLKDDLKYFKEITLGHTIVCGRKTYLSLPKRPLPERTNIVLTRGDSNFDNALVLHSKKEVIEYALSHPDKKIFICGGDNIYRQFIDVASKLYITEIDENKTIKADSFFPKIDSSVWGAKSSSNYLISDKGHRYRSLVYERLK
ncbi:MAG: dihydrofolate reductase [Catonella sp.]